MISVVSRDVAGMGTVVRLSGEQGARVDADYQGKFPIEQVESRGGGVAWLGKAEGVGRVCHGVSWGL